MKKVKLMIMTLMMCLTGIGFGQELKKDVPKSFKTELKTFNVELKKGDYHDYYYSRFEYGYEYPSIKKGYFEIGFSLKYKDLVKLYEELINIKNGIEGEYKLSVKLNNIVGVKRKGNKLIFECLYYSDYTLYRGYRVTVWSFASQSMSPKTIKCSLKYLESDLELIKSWE
jgi:hypothetical protein